MTQQKAESLQQKKKFIFHRL